MNSDGIIKKLLPADILLASEKGLKHSINRALGRSRWHHVMLYLGKGRVIEVTPRKGCHISKLDLTKNCYLEYRALRHKKISDAEKKKIAAAAVNLFLGRKFNWWQLAKVFLRRLLELKGNRNNTSTPDYRNGVNCLICSNLVAITYHLAGRAISSKWAPEYIMPRDYDGLEAADGFEVVFERKVKSGSGKNAA